MAQKYEQRPAWESSLLRFAVLIIIAAAGLLDAAMLWADMHDKAMRDLRQAQQINANKSANKQVRLNFPAQISVLQPASADDELAETAAQFAEPPAPNASQIAARSDEPQTGQDAPPTPPPHKIATTPQVESAAIPNRTTKQNSETEGAAAQATLETAPRDDASAASTQPKAASSPPATNESPAKPQAQLPPAAPHLIHLVVTDQTTLVDELVLLPKGLNLVTSVTHPRMSDYIAFASHLGHKVFLAFPASATTTDLQLMHPSLSDGQNLALLDRLLSDNQLLSGVKLYWNNPLADRTALMQQALTLINDRGLMVIGSNGPLELREDQWAAATGVDLIKIATVADPVTDIPIPDYGARSKPQTHIYGTLINSDRDLLLDWATRAKSQGWRFTPFPAPKKQR